MKIPNLRKRIIINLSASGILLILLGVGIYYNIDLRKQGNDEINQIKSKTSNLKSQISQLKAEETEFEKYSKIWQKISKRKREITGIKVDFVNKSLKNVSEKYAIGDPKIKITLPERLKDGIFNRKTIEVLNTTVTLDFTAVSDINAIAFIYEFLNSLPGYQIITRFDIRKGKDYQPQDYVAISAGTSNGNISGKVSFFWYAFKEKPKKTSETNK